MLPETPRGRLAWAIDESLVILGILVFWIGVVVVVTIGLSILALPFQLLGEPILRPLADLARAGRDLWVGVFPLTVISSSLYVLARVGELLVDHYVRTVGERADAG